MKTLLILVLAGGLLAAAFLTRPDRASFDATVKAQVQAGGSGSAAVKQWVRGLANNISADAYLQTVTFHDHYLWTSVDQNGTPQYTGAFSHWFKRGGGAAPAAAG